jgi:hypothetical protein
MNPNGVRKRQSVKNYVRGLRDHVESRNMLFRNQSRQPRIVDMTTMVKRLDLSQPNARKQQ